MDFFNYGVGQSLYLSERFHSWFIFLVKEESHKGTHCPPPLCLEQDVLSRYLFSLVRRGELILMKATRELWIPTHILYAYDILLFSKGKTSNIITLQRLFHHYYVAFSQIINVDKSTIYFGSMNLCKEDFFLNLTGFRKGNFPFNYLVVSIFKGRVK